MLLGGHLYFDPSYKNINLISTGDVREDFSTDPDLGCMNNTLWPALVARLYQQRDVAEALVIVDEYPLRRTARFKSV